MTDRELLELCRQAFHVIPTAAHSRRMLKRLDEIPKAYSGNGSHILCRVMADKIDQHISDVDGDGRDQKYLDAIRRLPCLVCRLAPCDAAHVRMGSHAGMGRKPSDRKTVPLCHLHHMQQHEIGEAKYWRTVIWAQPEKIIAGLNAAYPDINAMRMVVLAS